MMYSTAAPSVGLPAPPGAGEHPPAWHLLKFNPIGLWGLRRRLGLLSSEPGIYNLNRDKFDTADIAWMAAGMASEVLAPLGLTQFPPEFMILRNGTPSGQPGSMARSQLRSRVQRATFDLAALWDRTFGGATLVLHVEGTIRPNSPKTPDFVKSDVYFPAHFLQEDPRFSPIVSDMVQRFIAEIGLPVIERWERCARARWPMTQGAGNQAPPPYPSQPTQPTAVPAGSSTFVYHGRPLPPLDRVVVIDDDDDEFDVDDFTASQLDAINSIETHQFELQTLRTALSDTQQALDDALVREHDLRNQLDEARVRLASRADGATPHHQSVRHATPSTSTPSRRTLPQTYASPSRSGNSTPRKLFTGPSPAPSPSRSATRSIDAIAAYYDFLQANELSHLNATLDTIRNSIPMTSWREQLSKAGVPSILTETVMALMAAATSTG
ncbi:hypothetical protein BDZ97DRAFT_1921179 [Flammula alnicola]|nr:hypothetical protein BDZ97DRAFT_1921179 [Flammula alnicola]